MVMFLLLFSPVSLTMGATQTKGSAEPDAAATTSDTTQAAPFDPTKDPEEGKKKDEADEVVRFRCSPPSSPC